jgi:hypothetical protein
MPHPWISTDGHDAPDNKGSPTVAARVEAQEIHKASVTSTLALTIQISDHHRGRDGLLVSKSSRSKSFVSRILIPKFFRPSDLGGISC